MDTVTGPQFVIVHLCIFFQLLSVHPGKIVFGTLGIKHTANHLYLKVKPLVGICIFSFEESYWGQAGAYGRYGEGEVRLQGTRFTRLLNPFMQMGLLSSVGLQEGSHSAYLQISNNLHRNLERWQPQCCPKKKNCEYHVSGRPLKSLW